MKTMSNKSVIESYFAAFGKGNMESVLDHFHPDCLIVSVREGKRVPGQLHGSYQSKDQAKDFLANISNLFEVRAFNIESVMEAESDVVYANGSFTHLVKATGKLFKSTWVQRCVISDGMIKEYRFYEDSAAFVEAFKQQP
jgi:ketosteroid isomerase-like protein